MKTIEKLTIFNYIVSALAWLLGLLNGLFNLLGLWVAWHLTGFAYLAVSVIALLICAGVLMLSTEEKEKWLRKICVLRNGIALAISIAMQLLVFFVFAGWFR